MWTGLKNFVGYDTTAYWSLTNTPMKCVNRCFVDWISHAVWVNSTIVNSVLRAGLSIYVDSVSSLVKQRKFKIVQFCCSTDNHNFGTSPRKQSTTTCTLSKRVYDSSCRPIETNRPEVEFSNRISNRPQWREMALPDITQPCSRATLSYPLQFWYDL